MASEFDAECQTAMGVVPIIAAVRKHGFNVIERIALEPPAVDKIGAYRKVDAPITGGVLHVLQDRLPFLVLEMNAVQILAVLIRRADTDLDPSEFLGKRCGHTSQTDTCRIQVGRCAVFAHVGVDFDCDSEIAVDTSAIFHQQRRPD